MPNGIVAVCLGTGSVYLVCYSAHWMLNKDKAKCSKFMDEIGGFCFLSMVLAFLTPVLQSLTATYSSDTVTLLVVSFSICHLWAYDYERVKSLDIRNQPVVRSPTSLNAIFFAAIVLASRLTRFTSAFLLLF